MTNSEWCLKCEDRRLEYQRQRRQKARRSKGATKVEDKMRAAEVVVQCLRCLQTEAPELVTLATRWIEQKEQAVKALRQVRGS
jgi:hypothetical protein